VTVRNIATARALKKVFVLVLGYVICNVGARLCQVKLHFLAFLTCEMDADEWMDVVRNNSVN